MSPELESGRYVILGTASWAFLRYGEVRLKGRPLTHAAENLLELVVEAERVATREEEQLLARWHPASLERNKTGPKRTRARAAGLNQR